MDKRGQTLTLWQMVLLVLSIYVLGALFAQTVWSLPAEVVGVLDWADNAICVIFLGDFVYHLSSAPDRKAYLKWGWIDLVSSIPTLDALRWGRAVRVLRILRVLRAVRSVRTVLAIVFAKRAAGLLLTTGLASFLLVIGAAIAILNLEAGPGVKIRTASDALWWSFEMLISQGSGLYNPVTIEGRLLAAALSITGFVLLGAFVAGMSASVLGKEEAKIEAEESEILAQVQLIGERLAAIEARLEHGDGPPDKA
jgi:voltage-gated potassium channel